MAHRTSPQEAGTVFSRARPKLAVYTHFTLLSRPNVSPLTVDEVIAQTRETYDGALEAGTDLMSFEIGNGKVTVLRHTDRK